MEIPGCGEPGGRAEQKTRCCLGGQLGVDLGDEQGDRKGTREQSCAAAAPGGVPGWMQGWGHSLTWFVCALRDAETPCIPAATCMCFPPRAANLLFVWREPFIWCTLASAASFHAQCSEIKGCSFPRPLLNASGLLELVG